MANAQDKQWSDGGYRLRLRFSPVRDREIVQDLTGYSTKERAERVKEMLAFAYTVQRLLKHGGTLTTIGLSLNSHAATNGQLAALGGQDDRGSFVDDIAALEETTISA